MKIFDKKKEGKRRIFYFFGKKVFEFQKNRKNMKDVVKETEIIPNKIVFNNMNGKGYGCNPKYIAEEIIRQDLPYELVWLVDDVESQKENFPEGIKLCKYNTENAIREYASAKVWVSNQRMPRLYEKGLFKKEGQYYIQTWHGRVATKYIEKDIEKEKPWWCSWAKVDSGYIDLLTSYNKADKHRLSECFYYNGKITDFGVPRNDILYCSDNVKNEVSERLFELLNIPFGNKILLYAPTFRDDGRLDAYNLDISSCVRALKEKFKANFSVMVRLHPNIKEKGKEIFKSDNYLDVTDYPDIMELLLFTDVLITDYSSVMFDFIQTRRPVFIYASDLDRYLKERNLYVDIKNMFFPFAETNEQLVNNIINFDEQRFVCDVNEFIKCGESYDNGKASAHVVNIIKKIIKVG